MRVVMVSDVHCAGPSDPAQSQFIEWLDGLDADALWLLGDVFHWGWTFGGKPQSEYEPVFDALEKLVDRGIPLVFIPGNHDFALAPVFRERLRADVDGPHTRVVDGRRVFIAHGDEPVRAVGYRVLRWWIRSGLFRMVMAMLGPKRGTRLVQRFAGMRHPEGEMASAESLAFLGQALNEGADLAVMGHYHHATVDIVDGQGTRVVLGGGLEGAAWLENGALRV